MSAVVIRADARSLPLSDASVDLIVTSPPYWGQRRYEDGGRDLAGQIGQEPTPVEYLVNLWDCTREWVRVLKPEGSLWVNLGDKFNNAQSNQNLTGATARPAGGQKTYNPDWRGHVADEVSIKSLLGLPWLYAHGCTGALAALGGANPGLNLILRRDQIWHKTNPQPESVTDRCCTTHEYWFHLVKRPAYYADIDEIREYHAAPNRKLGAKALAGRNGSHPRTATTPYRGPNSAGKVPGSVWPVANETFQPPDDLGVAHYAPFPSVWPYRLIKGWCPPGGLVADPFGGTGTTALVADVLGRHGVSVDRSADYCHLANWRVNDPGERARALGVPKPPPVIDGQGDLFEEAS